MIAYLSGIIINKSQNYAIIRVGDIGYKVFVNPTMLAELNAVEDAEMYIHQYVREDALDLYGFKSLADLEMFEMLLSISGIGPKSALGVLAVAGVEDIKESIARGDSALLTKVSGIGRKTAERVVLELREKIGKISFQSKTNQDGGSIAASADEIDALMALGYSLAQAREALREVEPAIKDSGEKIREALKKLGR